MSVLVFVEAKDGKLSKAAFEAVSYGNKIGSTTVVTFGNVESSVLAGLGNYGAIKVLVNRNVNGKNEQQLTKLIDAAAQSVGADVVVMIQDQLGKAVGPRVAARMNAGHVSGAIAIPDTSNGFVVKSTVYSGKAYAFVKVNTAKKVISLVSNALPPVATGGTATVEEFSADLGDAKITVKEMKSQGAGVPLPEAELVVSAGRGLKGPENWGIVEENAAE